MFLLLCLFCILSQAQKLGIVSVTVADLMGTPATRTHPVNFQHNQLQLTQLLYMEQVYVLNQTNTEWLFVEAIHQPMYYEGEGWSGYEGFVQSNQIQVVESFEEPQISVVVQYTNVYTKPCHLQGKRNFFPLSLSLYYAIFSRLLT